jgi:hypothetical protein
MYILTRGKIQMKPVGNWLNGRLTIGCDMMPLLMT